MLAKAEGALVTKDELMAAVWPGQIVEDNAVQAHIAALRRILGRDSRLLTTARGRGYRLAASSATQGSASTPPARRRRASSRRTVLAAAALAAAGGSLYLLRDRWLPGAGGTREPSVAVLPFVNMSADKAQEYFSDGLSEELMTQLSQIEGLKVTGRTSAFAFKGRNQDLRTIGRKLGVANILEGSVRKSGDRLRITAQLIRASDGSHLWSQAYDRKLDDVFAIQKDIASAVSDALSVKLGVGVQGPDYGGTKSFEAYEHFLKAGRFWSGVDPAQMPARIDHLRKAVQIDPRYALAWANLSIILANVSNGAPPDQSRRMQPEREEAARRALALAPDLPAAQIADGWLHMDRRDWPAAEKAFMRAVTPGRGRDSAAVTIVGGYLTCMGRVREGLALRLQGRDSDPLFMGFSDALLRSYLMLRMWKEFDAEYDRSKDLQGDRRGPEFQRLMRLAAEPAPRAVIDAQIEHVVKAAPPPPHYALAIDRLRRPAGKAGVPLDPGPSPFDAFVVAEFAGASGDTETALQLLRRAVRTGGSSLYQRLWLPGFAGVRRDPRFKELMREIGYAQFWQASGKWPDFCSPLGGDDFQCR